MAVNQPPMQENQALAAWFLELVREIQRLEREIEELKRGNTN